MLTKVVRTNCDVIVRNIASVVLPRKLPC